MIFANIPLLQCVLVAAACGAVVLVYHDNGAVGAVQRQQRDSDPISLDEGRADNDLGMDDNTATQSHRQSGDGVCTCVCVNRRRCLSWDMPDVAYATSKWRPPAPNPAAARLAAGPVISTLRSWHRLCVAVSVTPPPQYVSSAGPVPPAVAVCLRQLVAVALSAVSLSAVDGMQPVTKPTHRQRLRSTFQSWRAAAPPTGAVGIHRPVVPSSVLIKVRACKYATLPLPERIVSVDRHCSVRAQRRLFGRSRAGVRAGDVCAALISVVQLAAPAALAPPRPPPTLAHVM